MDKKHILNLCMYVKKVTESLFTVATSSTRVLNFALFASEVNDNFDIKKKSYKLHISFVY